VSPAISIKNTEERPQNRNLVGATVNAPGDELAKSSDTFHMTPIIVSVTLLMGLFWNPWFPVFAMMIFYVIALIVLQFENLPHHQAHQAAAPYTPPRAYRPIMRTESHTSPERPGYHRMVRAGGKYRPWVPDR